MRPIFDGNSLQTESSSSEIIVRFLGIDAPETSRRKNEPGQPFSQQATKHLAGLVLNRVVEVKGFGMDRYNRILRVIFVDGVNVNLEMVSVGLAEVYDGKPPRGFDTGPYFDEEKEARDATRGMWIKGGQICQPQTVEESPDK